MAIIQILLSNIGYKMLKNNKNPSATKLKSNLNNFSTHCFMNHKFLPSIGEIPTHRYLSVLYLHNNQISKIENLDSAVNLTCLYLQKNNIAKIENLRALTKLKILNLGHNEISVVEGLETLKNLEELHVEKQKLEVGDSLCFDPRTVMSISKSLQVLNIAHNFISTLSHLLPLKKLRMIKGNNNNIYDINDVTNTIQHWYYLEEAIFTANPISQEHRYRENIIANTSSLSILDDKIITDVTRTFIKRFEQQKLNRVSRPSVNLASKIPYLPNNYPPPMQKAASECIFQTAKHRFTDDKMLHNTADDSYLPWNALPKKSVGPSVLKRQTQRSEKKLHFSTTFPQF